MKLQLVTLTAVLTAETVLATPQAATAFSSSPACGEKGYDKGNPIAYYYSTQYEDPTVKHCATRCAGASKCKSYSYGAGKCLLYTSTL